MKTLELHEGQVIQLRIAIRIALEELESIKNGTTSTEIENDIAGRLAILKGLLSTLQS